MDYVELFENLKPNTKYARKSPLKAVLLLAVIDMYENQELYSNEIKLNETLRNTYAKIWNKVVPEKAELFSDVFLPYWYMNNEDFWHTVPLRGKEYIIDLLGDSSVLPSESILKDSVDYAELDEDLYFMITLQSGRASLKRALLENYTSLSPVEIDEMSASKDMVIDYSISAIDNYKSILSSEKTVISASRDNVSSDVQLLFSTLSEDIQYAINIEYYSFLKNHKAERKLFQEICPTVYDLVDKMTDHPLRQNEVSPSAASMYENFLSDLRITLMGEDGGFELIDKIQNAIRCLHDEECVKNLYAIEEEVFEDMPSFAEPEANENLSPVEVSDMPKVTEENILSFYVENSGYKGYVFDAFGECLFSVGGRLKIFHGKVFRFNYKSICFTVKDLVCNEGAWEKGTKQFVAYSDSDLYPHLDKENFIDQIEDFEPGTTIEQNRMCVDGKWYNFHGDYIEDATYTEDSESNDIEQFIPKGALKRISKIISSSYDYLWIIAIIDLMGEKNQKISLTYDELACAMIAYAWEILANNEALKKKESSLVECIEYLIEEFNEYMDVKLYWNSSREDIYEAIKDYPMGGVFEDTVEELLETAPINILKAWIKVEDTQDIIMHSISFSNSCLYALHPNNRNPYIEINRAWKRYIYNEYGNLINYFNNQYVGYLCES